MSFSHLVRSQEIVPLDNKNKILQFSKTKPSIEEISIFLNQEFLIDMTTDNDIINGYDHDSSNIKGQADALCRPIDKIECSIIIVLCNYLKIPITFSAGRTNLTGSATPKGGIILSISKMNKIDNFDLENKKVSLSPGVYIEDIRNYIINESKNNLIFPVDPTSRKEAMLGGAISCNASGFIPGIKGAMRYWVHGIELILSNGEIITASRGQYISKNGEFTINHSDGKQSKINVPTYSRPDIKNASGPFTAIDGKVDFIDLIIGSEGIFGFIASSTLNLENKPSDYLNLFIKLKNEDQAFRLYTDINSYLNGKMSSLSGFEYFGKNCSSFMDNYEYFFDDDYRVGVYVQIPIYNNNIDLVIEDWFELLTNLDYIKEERQIISLNDSNTWKIFFNARHSMPVNALHKSKESNTKSIITDTIVPPRSFKKYITKTHELIQSKKIDYLLFGHLGDCHLHFHLIPDLNNEDQANECYRKIIQLSAKLGGVYSAEHGTGKRKKIDFIECYGKTASKQVMECKISFDPNFIFNVGNVFDR
jgi:D-lactate dehydrogenase (cytochrome)